MRGSQMKKPGKRMVEMMRGAMEPGVDQPFEAPRVLKASIKRTMTTSILDIYETSWKIHPCQFIVCIGILALAPWNPKY